MTTIIVVEIILLLKLDLVFINRTTRYLLECWLCFISNKGVWYLSGEWAVTSTLLGKINLCHLHHTTITISKYMYLFLLTHNCCQYRHTYTYMYITPSPVTHSIIAYMYQFQEVTHV